MNDQQDEIRQLLRERAREVTPHLEVPRTLTTRVRSRIVRNVLATAATLAVIAVLGAAGFRTVHEPAREPRDGGGPAPTGSQACQAETLDPTLSLEGAAGSREGSILLRNISDIACDLRGTPDVELVRTDGSPAPVERIEGLPRWQVDGSAQPHGWPLVTLDPGERASVRLRWSNWCDQETTPTVRLIAEDGRPVATIPVETFDLPPCNGSPGSASTVEVGPFEPAG
jgi:Domain of unknown function (DUF4232)